MTEHETDPPFPDPWTVGPYHPLNPIGWLDRLFTAQAKRELTDEKTYVVNPRRLRRLFWWDVSTFLTIVALVVVEAWTAESTVVNALVLPIICLLIGRTLLARMVRARAYRNGWLDGRRQMVGSMAEAVQRGFTIEEWLEGEIERDIQVNRFL